MFELRIVVPKDLGLFRSGQNSFISIADGSVLDNRTSGSGRLLDTGLKYR